MNRQEADQLVIRIGNDDPDLIIKGVLAWGGGFSGAPSFVISVEDPRSRSSANITSPEDWEKRIQARQKSGSHYTIL